MRLLFAEGHSAQRRTQKPRETDCVYTVSRITILVTA